MLLVVLAECGTLTFLKVRFFVQHFREAIHQCIRPKYECVPRTRTKLLFLSLPICWVTGVGGCAPRVVTQLCLLSESLHFYKFSRILVMLRLNPPFQGGSNGIQHAYNHRKDGPELPDTFYRTVPAPPHWLAILNRNGLRKK